MTTFRLRWQDTWKKFPDRSYPWDMNEAALRRMSDRVEVTIEVDRVTWESYLRYALDAYRRKCTESMSQIGCYFDFKKRKKK